MREPVSRLRQADAVVVNSGQAVDGEFAMSLTGSLFYNLLNPGTIMNAGEFAGQRLHAIAGIGHPQRFFCAPRTSRTDHTTPCISRPSSLHGWRHRL